MKAIHPPNAASPLAPYSPAIAVNGMLFISGQIALDENGELHLATISEETERIMQNIGNLLRAAGLGFQHVVKCTIFMNDMAHYATVNEVYGRYFTEVPPAREAVAVKGLPRNVNVEISAIACG